MANVQWENGIVGIPLNADLTVALDQIGKDGWEPWTIIGKTADVLQVAVKRPKQAIVLANELPRLNGELNQ